MERQDSHANWADALNDFVKKDYEAFKIEAGNVLDLTVHPGYTFVQTLIEGHIRRQERRMLYGKPLEQAEYAQLAGEIVGLRKIREVADTVLFVAEKEDEKRGDDPARLAAV